MRTLCVSFITFFWSDVMVRWEKGLEDTLRHLSLKKSSSCYAAVLDIPDEVFNNYSMSARWI